MYKKINSLLFDVREKRDFKGMILFYILQLIVIFLIVNIISFIMGLIYGITYPSLKPPTTDGRSIVTMEYLVYRYYPVCLSLFIITQKKRLYNFILDILGLTPIVLVIIGGPWLSLIPPTILLAFSPSKKGVNKKIV